MTITNFLQKVTPALVLFVVILGALNAGSYDPYNELTVLTPDVARASLVVPTLDAPSLSSPTLSAPTISVPVVSTPTIAVPSVTAPVIETPTVSVPVVTAPVVSVPTVSTPAITVPTVTTPSVTVPTVNVPTVTVPTVVVPTLGTVTASSSSSSGSGTSTFRSCEVRANLYEVNFGSSVTISWTNFGYTTATLNGVAVDPSAGFKTFTNVQADTTFTLVANTADGNNPCTSTVTVRCVLPPAILSCTELGYDFTAAKFTWNGYMYVKATGGNANYQITVAGNDTQANWTSNKAITAIIAQTANTNRVFTNNLGLSGTISKCDIGTGCDKITKIEFCGNEETVTPAPVCTLAPGSTTINSGGSVNLVWTTQNASTASLTDFGNVPLNGSQNTGPLTSSKNYNLTVVGINGQTISCPAHITVRPPVQAVPTCTLTPASSTINSGESVNLVWTTTNASSTTLTDFGTVPLNGSQNTGALTATKNYTLTVVGLNGQTISCPAHVSVKPPVYSVPSCDAFTVAPTSIKRGETATLAWATTNASRIVINNGIGEVSATGTLSIAPLATTTYLLTAYGVNNQQDTCDVTIGVQEPPVVIDAPKCEAFTATPASLPAGGGTVTLTWATKDATGVSIAPTIGQVSANGSTTVAITSTQTFTLTAAKVGSTSDTCAVTIPVAPVVDQPLTCAANVNLSVNPNLINRGGEATLTWTTTGVTGVSFDNGITATGLSGSTVVSPSNSTTYTLTATNGTETVSCPIPVSVRSGGGGGGGSSAPRCELSISDNKINRGDDVVLTWESTRATDISLEDETENDVLVTTSGLLSSAKERLLDGKITVSPEQDTTYVLTVKRGSTTRKCTVDVELDDNIVVTEVRNQPLVAGIALTQVPYTGFEAGPILTLLFYTLLMAWALYVAYLLVIKRDTLGGLSLVSGPKSQPTPRFIPEQIRPDVFVASVKAPEMPISTLPTNLPTGNPAIGYVNHVEEAVTTAGVASHQIDDTEMTKIENHAHAQQVLLSSDAIRHFIATTNTDTERTIALDQVIVAAKAQYPAEDGWVVLNEKRMQDLCLICAVNAQKVASTPYIPAVVPQGAGSLAEAIVTGNVVAAYELIGNRPMFALADAAADLDAVYRIRRGIEATASELLMKETAMLTNEQILKTIEALTGALDGAYNDEASAVKVAIMKAIKVVA